MKLLVKLQHSLSFWVVVGISFLFFLLRLPSFFEPYWYGDEGVYEVLGFAIRHGRLLYQGIWDNKPPLLYLTYAIFDGNQFAAKILSFIFGIGAIMLLFFIAKKIFTKNLSIYASIIFFVVLFGLPLIEGNIANAENFMLLPIFAGILLVIKTTEEKQKNFLLPILAGFLFGISFLYKVVGIFDFSSAFLLIIFIDFKWNREKIFITLSRLFLLSIGFILPLLATIGFFALNGTLKIFIQSAFLSNVGYVNSGNILFLPFTHFAIPQGYNLLKLSILFFVLIFVFFKRKSLSAAQLLIFIWLSFSVFNAFFSGRPYTHYVLTVLGAMSLLFGYLFEKRRILESVLFIVVILLLAKNFYFYGKIPEYYTNFLQFLIGTKSVSNYQSFFDQGVPRDYAVADFLTRNGNGKTEFLWTNSAQIYYLTKHLPIGRFTVAYHMTLSPANISETFQDLNRIKPDFVVILPNASSFPFSMTNYKLKAVVGQGLIYEKIFK